MSNFENQQVLPTGWDGTTYRNSKIRSYNDVKQRVLAKLGVGAETYINNFSFATIVDEALERYSRYAGYDQEYVIICDEALDSGCGIKLDDLVNSCLCNRVASAQGDIIETTFVSATNIDLTLVAECDSLLSSFVSLSSNGQEAVNLQETVDVNCLELYFDPEKPWNFDSCNVNQVNISPIIDVPETEILSPCLSADLNISNGLAEFCPPYWEDKSKCEHLSSWWNIPEGEYLSSFDIEAATHVIVKNVPSCTVEGVNALSLNNGRIANFKVANQSLDTCGNIPAQVQFVRDFSLPDSLSGNFDVSQNTGFKLKLDTSEIDDFVCTPELLDVNVEFYEAVSSFEYGVSATTIDPFLDDVTNCPRKVSGIFDISNGGSSNGGNLLFNLQYDVIQGAFGYDGTGNRFHQQGYDLTTYELSLQYIEQVQKIFGGGNKINCEFNPRTQRLKVFRGNSSSYGFGNCNNGCYLLGVYLERSIEDMISETWVLDYVLAETKITIGNQINQYQNVTSIGGISVNGTDLLSQGISERDALLTKLQSTNSEGSLYQPIVFY